MAAAKKTPARKRPAKKRAAKHPALKKGSSRARDTSRAKRRAMPDKPAGRASGRNAPARKDVAGSTRAILVTPDSAQVEVRGSPVTVITSRGPVQFLRERLPTPEQIRAGIETELLDWLGDWLGVSEAELNEVLRISRTTRKRREESGVLTHEESDRVATVMRVVARAVDYFDGNDDAAQRWMRHPAPALNGETPLHHCDTAIGAQRVIRLLSQLEHGIPA